jgi:uncharacterized membrane protein
MAALVAFILFVIAFIVRAINDGGLEAEDWVLWMLAGLAALAFAFSPAVAYIQARRRPAAG